MNLSCSPEQAEIVSSVTTLLGAEMPMGRVREISVTESSRDSNLWSMCAGLGWFGLGLDEAAGGVGYGLAEEALLFRELGRHLTPGPWLSTVLGARVAAVVGPPDVAEAILEGKTAVGLAQAALAGRQAAPGQRVISGPVELYDAVDADLVLMVSAAGAGLYPVEGLGSVEQAESLDPGVRVGTANAGGVAPVAWVDGTDEPVHRRGLVLAAAASAGVAEAARDLAAEHARARVQFGRPIGVNQAVKHACADMAVRAEAATSMTFYAALATGAGRADAAFCAHSAKVVAADAAIRNARAALQVYGGMGFTWVHDIHLLVKRADVLGHLLGGRRAILAALIDLPAAQ